MRKPVIVGNISAGSWGPGNWLAYVQEYGFFDADLVVLVVSSHDIADNPSFAPLNPDTHPTSRPFSALSEAVTRYLPKYLPKARSGRTEERETLEPEGSESPQLKGMSDLREFLTLATSHCKCVYVVQHLERSEIEKDQKKPGYNAIRELCGNLEIECDSLEMAFKDSLKKGVSPYRPNDNIHPNEIGQALIADVLIEIIERFLEEQELSP